MNHDAIAAALAKATAGSRVTVWRMVGRLDALVGQAVVRPEDRAEGYRLISRIVETCDGAGPALADWTEYHRGRLDPAGL